MGTAMSVDRFEKLTSLPLVVLQVSHFSQQVFTLQSLLQIKSRAAALMLAKEGPGILDLTPNSIMQRLVDLKVPQSPSALLCC